MSPHTTTLAEIFEVKAARRKRLASLPVAERIVIIEQLHELGLAMRAARRDLAEKRRSQ